MTPPIGGEDPEIRLLIGGPFCPGNALLLPKWLFQPAS
jgi:hypothetical protein